MSAEILRTIRPLTVCRWDTDKTMRFFHMPSGAIVAIVEESLVSGCVEILYERFVRDFQKQPLVALVLSDKQSGMMTSQF